MLQCQKGNCFDFSTLLCSMLIGSGYDAYCVNGYGSLDLCLMDLTREVCPLTVKAKEVFLARGNPKNAQSWDRPSLLKDRGAALAILRENKNWVSALIILREAKTISALAVLGEASSHVGFPYTCGLLTHPRVSTVAPDSLLQTFGDFSVLGTTHSPLLQTAVPLSLS